MSDRTALVLDQPTQCCGARILIKALGGGYICPCGKKHKIKHAYPVNPSTGTVTKKARHAR
jgi:hypothetical protein